MRRSFAVIPAIPVMLLVAACGGGAGGGVAADPAVLRDVAYAVTGLSVGGDEIGLQGPVTLAFGADAVAIDTPCNDMTGSIQYGDTTLTIGPLAATKMACDPTLMQQDQIIAEGMSANPQWQVADGRLTLTGGEIVIVAESVTADTAS